MPLSLATSFLHCSLLLFLLLCAGFRNYRESIFVFVLEPGEISGAVRKQSLVTFSQIPIHLIQVYNYLHPELKLDLERGYLISAGGPKMKRTTVRSPLDD
jgi:hypothetical protein